MNPSIQLVETYFLSDGNSLLLFRAITWCWKPLLKLEGANFKRKTFSSKQKPFSLIFLPEEAVFPYWRNLFFNKCFILDRENGFSGQYKPFFIFFFRDSCQRKLFFIFESKRERFFLSGNLFLNKSFIPAIEEGFFSLMETVTLLESFFLLAETVTAMKPIFQDRTYSCWWKLIFWLVETIFFHCLISFP